MVLSKEQLNSTGKNASENSLVSKYEVFLGSVLSGLIGRNAAIFSWLCALSETEKRKLISNVFFNKFNLVDGQCLCIKLCNGCFGFVMCIYFYNTRWCLIQNYLSALPIR